MKINNFECKCGKIYNKYENYKLAIISCPLIDCFNILKNNVRI